VPAISSAQAPEYAGGGTGPARGAAAAAPGAAAAAAASGIGIGGGGGGGGIGGESEVDGAEVEYARALFRAVGEAAAAGAAAMRPREIAALSRAWARAVQARHADVQRHIEITRDQLRSPEITRDQPRLPASVLRRRAAQRVTLAC